MELRIAFVAAVLAPALVLAQVRPTSPVVGALVKKSIPRANITAAPGTSISTVSAYNGIPCAESCIIAKGGALGKGAGVTVHFADGSVRVEEVRTGLVLPNDKAHAISLTLDRSEILGMQCNERGEMKASPVFRTLGASSTGFKWEIFQGAKMLKSSHSNGEPVAWNGDGHTMGTVQLAVFSDATIEISHGDSRLVMTSDDGPAIEAKSGGTLRFEDLGLHVAGVPEFGVTLARIQGTNK